LFTEVVTPEAGAEAGTEAGTEVGTEAVPYCPWLKLLPLKLVLKLVLKLLPLKPK
jgi:hypothetical protein